MAKKIDASKKIISKKHLARKEKERRQTRIILIATFGLLAIVVGLVGYGLVDNYIIKPRKPIAHVGEKVITVGDFQTRVKYSRINLINQAYMNAQYAGWFGAQGGSFMTSAQQIIDRLDEPMLVGKDAIDQMIDDILIYEEAEKRGITVSEEELTEAMQAGFEFFPDGTPTPTQTATLASTPTLSGEQLALLRFTSTPTAMATATEIPEGWSPTSTLLPTQEVSPTESKSSGIEESLEEATPEAPQTEVPTETVTPTPTPYTTEGYAKAIDNYLDSIKNIGLNRSDLVHIFETQILRKKLLDEITSDLQPFEERVWARHILVETEELAIEILGKLDNGDDWYALASEYSIDEGSKEMGGDLGWFGKGNMVAEFENAAFALEKIGELSQPIQTQFGFHIIQLLGKGEMPINTNEFNTLKDNTFTTWLSELRDSRDDISIEPYWIDFVPAEPGVPPAVREAIYSIPQ